MTVTENRPVPQPAEHHEPSLLETFRQQPRTVWVTAFGAVIAFMGIGLVDPILNSIAGPTGPSAQRSDPTTVGTLHSSPYRRQGR